MSGWGTGASSDVIDCLDTITRKSGGNYGVLCGPRSGIIVIDYDLDKVPDLLIDLESLKGVHGDTMIVQTPKGGFHVYHLYDSRFEMWIGRCGISGYIDIRTHGNYVVGPGSIVNGKVYTVVNDVDPARMPDEIYECLDEHARGARYSSGKSIEVSEYDGALETLGFTNISWVSDYNFDCDQKGPGTLCPLCSMCHESNHFFLWEIDGTVYVKNHSNRCKRMKVADSKVYESNCVVEETISEYELMKDTIDKIVFKVSDPLCYCIKRSENKLQMCTFAQLREIYSTYILHDEKGHEYNFFDQWSKDPTKVEYENMDFLPPPLKCPESTYNLWTGFKFIETAKVGTIEPFLDLMGLVEGGSQYMIHYLADLVQNPGRLPLVGIILRGIEGSGKNSITELISRLIGNEYYFSSTDPAIDVFCRFSESRHRKLCINFDEAESKKMFSENENIKGLITSPYLNYEQKGLTPIRVRSFSRVITTTNNRAPLKISQNDRRWCAFEMCEKFVKNKKHWDSFYHWLDQSENIRCIYDYLMSVDLSCVDLKDIPDTDALNEIKQACLPLEIKWVVDLIVDRFPRQWNNDTKIFATTLHEDYNKFLPLKCAIDSRAFGLMLSKHKFPGFTKGPRTNQGATWTIDREKVYRWLIEKKFIRSDVMLE